MTDESNVRGENTTIAEKIVKWKALNTAVELLSSKLLSPKTCGAGASQSQGKGRNGFRHKVFFYGFPTIKMVMAASPS